MSQRRVIKPIPNGALKDKIKEERQKKINTD
jgi:hypothetical protein